MGKQRRVDWIQQLTDWLSGSPEPDSSSARPTQSHGDLPDPVRPSAASFQFPLCCGHVRADVTHWFLSELVRGSRS
ncbi:hypothetical protein AMECASPLE_016298 [Ameca splendens]|uniref:Uncharacterized protein n=1 Tax=Ameca splendens TaxID=208324 RepID=A0ABV1A900_9TELE